jgi:hypothetical protein
MTRTLCWGKVQGRFPDGNKFTLDAGNLELVE